MSEYWDDSLLLEIVASIANCLLDNTLSASSYFPCDWYNSCQIIETGGDIGMFVAQQLSPTSLTTADNRVRLPHIFPVNRYSSARLLRLVATSGCSLPNSFRLHL